MTVKAPKFDIPSAFGSTTDGAEPPAKRTTGPDRQLKPGSWVRVSYKRQQVLILVTKALSVELFHGSVQAFENQRPASLVFEDLTVGDIVEFSWDHIRSV